MSSEIPQEPTDTAADEPKVFQNVEDDANVEDDHGDHLSDIKGDLVDEVDNKDSQGENSESGENKDERKPLSLYPEGLSPNLFSHTLFNHPTFTLPYLSSLYNGGLPGASPDLSKEGPFPGLNPFQSSINPWARYQGLSGLQYPFPGLRPPGLQGAFGHFQNPAAQNLHKEREHEAPQKKPKSKKPHIKKPLNAFMLYMKEQRAKVVSECTLKESAAINQILGRKWHALNKEEQQKYYEMARKEREKHMVMYPGWSARDNYGKRKKNKDGMPGGQQMEDYTSNDGGSAKKCRAVYGLEAQHMWCAPCRRKKKCVRYPEGDDFPQHNGIQGNSLLSNSPLALGMLQGSPLSPHFNQGSPGGYMSHSPLGMADHSAMLAAAQMQNALNTSALSGMLNAARPPFSTSQGMPFGMCHPLGGKVSPIGRGTPSSDGGSGSAGNGPTIQGSIEVKLEETDDQLSPCVSPEPAPPMKRPRLEPQGIAT